MKNLLITSVENIHKEGVTITFNKPFALNGNLATKQWYVSWDKIGKALCGDKYCEFLEVPELNKLRDSLKKGVEGEKQLRNIDFDAIARGEDSILIIND